MRRKSRFRRRLLFGEQILWEGRPALWPIFVRRDLYLIPFSLAWLGFAAFWTYGVVHRHAALFLRLWGVMLVGVGLFLVIGRFLLDAWGRYGIRYAVTDQRILILGPLLFRDRFTALALAELPDIELVPGRSELGTIRFGKALSRGLSGGIGFFCPSFEPAPQFIAIAHADRVFDLIQQAIGRSSGNTDAGNNALDPLIPGCDRGLQQGGATATSRSEGRDMGLGFRINKRHRKVSAELVAAFRPLPVANISDCMARMTAGGPRLRPMHAGGVMAGPALTVRTRPGDNLMVHKALDLAEPGDVVVVDGGGDLTNALIGEIMSTYAQARGIAGIVINGSIRDVDALRASPFPVYAAGVTHRGPYKDGPGEINVAIAFDGMVIEPGDLVIGDGDGLLCVPFEAAEAICQAAQKKLADEEKVLGTMRSGTLPDRSWIDAALTRLGCTFE